MGAIKRLLKVILGIALIPVFLILLPFVVLLWMIPAFLLEISLWVIKGKHMDPDLPMAALEWYFITLPEFLFSW